MSIGGISNVSAAQMDPLNEVQSTKGQFAGNSITMSEKPSLGAIGNDLQQPEFPHKSLGDRNISVGH